MSSYSLDPDQGPAPGNPAWEPEIPGWARIGLVAMAATLIALLVVAARLEPDPRGFGTHEQLGLYPCTTMYFWGIRCPACGMTTAWTRLLHGDVWGALRANLGGVLLAGVALAAIPWALGSAARGRWAGVGPGDWSVAGGLATVVGITLIEWAWKLAR